MIGSFDPSKNGTVVAHRTLRTIEVPLFDFSAPNVSGCSVMLEHKKTTTVTQEWTLTILGVGGGGKTTYRTSLTSSFSAAAGERKRVFLPVRAEGMQFFRTRDRQLIPTKRKLVWSMPDAPGIVLVSNSADEAADRRLTTLLPTLLPTHKLTTFFLAGDTTGAPAVFDYEYENSATFGMNASITVLGSAMTAGVSVQQFGTLRLKCHLVSGQNYELRSMPTNLGGSTPGVTWSLSEPKRSPARRLDPARKASDTRGALPRADHGISDGSRAIRRKFIEKITQRGWWLGPGAKHIYYHSPAPGAPRIVLGSTRIRLEISIGRHLSMSFGSHIGWSTKPTRR